MDIVHSQKEGRAKVSRLVFFMCCSYSHGVAAVRYFIVQYSNLRLAHCTIIDRDG